LLIVIELDLLDLEEDFHLLEEEEEEEVEEEDFMEEEEDHQEDLEEEEEVHSVEEEEEDLIHDHEADLQEREIILHLEVQLEVDQIVHQKEGRDLHLEVDQDLEVSNQNCIETNSRFLLQKQQN